MARMMHTDPGDAVEVPRHNLSTDHIVSATQELTTDKGYPDSVNAIQLTGQLWLHIPDNDRSHVVKINR